MKKISIIGLGYVGLPLACILSNLKRKNKYIYKVDGYDKKLKKNIDVFYNFKEKILDKKLVKIINQTKTKRLINFTNDYSHLRKTKVVVVSINFHFSKKNYDLSFKKIKNLFSKIAQNINKDCLIFIETTLPPGTSEKIIIPEIKKIFRRRNLNTKRILFAHSYERVTPGKDYYNSIVNINRCFAGYNENSANECYKFLKSFINTKKYKLFRFKKIIDCETAKILENSYRAINIALIDEWTKYSILSKVNLNKIIDAIKLRNTHNNIMSPGLGVGGYCLTKDPDFAQISNNYFFKGKNSFPITSRATSINKRMPLSSIEFLEEKSKINKKSKILVMGASYKGDVGDMRSAPSLSLLKNFKRKKFNVVVHDPFAEKKILNFPILKLIPKFKDYDYVIFCTSHSIYKKIKLINFSKKPIYFDLNRVLDNSQIKWIKSKNIKLEVLGDNE